MKNNKSFLEEKKPDVLQDNEGSKEGTKERSYERRRRQERRNKDIEIEGTEE